MRREAHLPLIATVYRVSRPVFADITLASVTLILLKKGIIIVPLPSIPTFMFGAVNTSYSPSETSSENLQSLVTHFCNKRTDPSRDQSIFLAMKAFCGRIWEPQPVNRYTYLQRELPKLGVDAGMKLLQASMRMRDWEFFEKVGQNVRGIIRPDFVECIQEEIENGLAFADIQKQ